jgi:hypothetical protein
MLDHSFYIANILRHSLELSSFLLQASPLLSFQVLIHSYSYLKALPQKCLEEKVSHDYSSQNSFLEIIILLWAIPYIESSFHGFQAFKSSCISLKKA